MKKTRVVSSFESCVAKSQSSLGLLPTELCLLFQTTCNLSVVKISKRSEMEMLYPPDKRSRTTPFWVGSLYPF